MQTKVYESFDQINKDLKIMKIEKDLAYHKMVREFEDTKESLEFKNLIGETPKKIINVLGMVAGPLKSAALTFLLKKIF